MNPGINTKPVKGLKNVSECRGRRGGRVYFQRKDGTIQILAKSNKHHQKRVLSILKKLGY